MKNIVIALCFLFLISCNTANKNEGVLNSSAEVEFPTKSETLWSDKTELFVEFPALVVGEPSRFAAHFTILDKHKPVTEGQVTVSLVKKGNIVDSNIADSPTSPGIFSPTIMPKQPGNYQLVFQIRTPKYSDELIIQDVIVYSTKENAIDALSSIQESGGISFLKEQAWKMDFQTAPAVKKEVYEAVQTFGFWETTPENLQTLVATSTGKISFLKKNLTTGTYVKKDEEMMVIESKGFTSNDLDAEIQKAKAIYNQAKEAYDRKKQLFESKIISKANWGKTERDYQVAKENLQSLSNGYSKKGKQVKAPFSGYIQSLTIQNGGFANEGDPLFTVTDSKSSLLKIQVSPKYANKLNEIGNVWYRTEKNTWSNINKNKGEVISVDKTVSQDKPMLYVFARVNEPVSMPVGSTTEVTLSLGKPVNGIVIPASALLEEYGNYSIIVQLSGESFEKRDITLGKRNGDEVEILSGVKAGEVVVSRGAYQIKTASMSGQAPAHGHAH